MLCDAAEWEGKTSANPHNLWQGFADKQLVPKECVTSTDSALESKDLNPGLRLLRFVPGVWSRCKLPHGHKVRRLSKLKSHLCRLKERHLPEHSTHQFRIRIPASQAGKNCALLLCACEPSVRKGKKSKGIWGLQGSLWCQRQPLCSLWLQRRERDPWPKAIVQLGWNVLPAGNANLQEQSANAGVCS